MTGLRTLVSVAALLLLALASVSASSEGTLPLELAEMVPLSTEELMRMAEQGGDFAAPQQIPQMDDEDTQPALAEMQQQADSDPVSEEEHHSLAEVDQQSEAQVEAQVEAEAATETPGAAPAVTPEPAATPAPDAAPSVVVPAAPTETAAVRLIRHRGEVAAAEQGLVNQEAQMAELLKTPPAVQKGESASSGSNYYESWIKRAKGSHGVAVSDHASDLTQTDARCVICQFVVQQTITTLTGKPLTFGGATSGGKRAATAASEPAAAAGGGAAAPAESSAPAAAAGGNPMIEGQSFLELEAEAEDFHDASDLDEEELELDAEDPFAFLELDASVDVMAEAGMSAVLAAEAESLQALDAAAETFLAASDAAMEHSAAEAMASHYRFFGSSQLRNVQAPSYPRQLNDWGFDETKRNRAADILAFRPRQARFSRGEVEASKKKWDEQRATYQKLYAGVYQAFEKLCTKRMPLAYAGYCQDIMKDYRYIAQGIAYGDRAQSICMNGNWCDRKAYIRNAVHAYFVREAGDV